MGTNKEITMQCTVIEGKYPSLSTIARAVPLLEGVYIGKLQCKNVSSLQWVRPEADVPEAAWVKLSSADEAKLELAKLKREQYLTWLNKATKVYWPEDAALICTSVRLLWGMPEDGRVDRLYDQFTKDLAEALQIPVEAVMVTTITPSMEVHFQLDISSMKQDPEIVAQRLIIQVQDDSSALRRGALTRHVDPEYVPQLHIMTREDVTEGRHKDFLIRREEFQSNVMARMQRPGQQGSKVDVAIGGTPTVQPDMSDLMEEPEPAVKDPADTEAYRSKLAAGMDESRLVSSYERKQHASSWFSTSG